MIVLSDRYVKHTKKKHCCYVCGKMIDIGSHCYRQANIQDDDFVSVYWHYDCSSDSELENWYD
jgi:hypothetical protein